MVGWAHQSAGPGSMEEAVRATHRADALQPEREILLQICCRCSNGRSRNQLFIAVGGAPRVAGRDEIG